MTRIQINKHLSLSQIKDQDAHTLVSEIGHKAVVDNILQVPYPYQLSDAISWINYVEQQRTDFQKLVNWAIRYDEELIGGIGRHMKYGKDAHKDEIGYWLGPTHWNKGIMSAVLNSYCDFLMNEDQLIRLEAPVFDFNISSQKVLEKTGFVKEGMMHKAYQKNGQFLDAILYAKVAQ